MITWLGGFLVAVVAGACTSVLAIGLWLSSPALHRIGSAPADLAAEDVTFRSGTGPVIRGWFVPGRSGGGAVVLMHGLHANRLAHLKRARLLHDAGFSVLLFDFPGHGESDSRRITFGAHEAHDAVAAVAFMRRRLPNEKVGVIGTSLGGAAALLAPEPLHLDALVLEAVYPDIGSATANRVNAVVGVFLGSLISNPVAHLFELIMGPVLGVAPRDLRPIDRIAEVGAPILIIAGGRDNRTTLEESKVMLGRAREPKSLWLIENAGHVDFEAHAPEQYRERVGTFLAQALRNK